MAPKIRLKISSGLDRFKMQHRLDTLVMNEGL